MQRRTYTTYVAGAISLDRLGPYGAASGTVTPAALANYFWNIALCEALYPTIHCVEITLRNNLYTALSGIYGSEWLLANPPILRQREDAQVVSAAEDLCARTGLLARSRDLIPELDFGLWTSLFARDYDPTVWQQKGVIATAFPLQPYRRRVRAELSDRFNTIRKLRNRVFHHEPIWNRPDLPQRHRDIIEALGWMNPAMHFTLTTPGFDNFPIVYARGSAHYLGLVTTILASMLP